MAATGTPTPNIGLRRAQGTDPASVDDINYNSALIDTKLGAVGNSSVQDQIDTLNDKMATQDISSNVTTDKGTFGLKQVNTILNAVFVTVELTLSTQVNAGQTIITGLPKAKGNYVNIFVKQGNTPKSAYMDNNNLTANETLSSGANIQMNYSYVKQ